MSRIKHNYVLTYFVQKIIRLQYKNSIKVAKSEKDARFGIRTRASKSVVPSCQLAEWKIFIHDKDKGNSRDN